MVQLINIPSVTEEDIDSTYRLGKQREGKVRDVLVKFSSKKKRDLYYSRRKDTPKDVNNMKAFINEDLTPYRSKLFFDARCLVKRKRLHSTWTQGGNIMIKAEAYDTPVPVFSHEDLRSILHRAMISDEGSETYSDY